ncbi:MAG: DNA repair protein RecN [Desulfobacteraceae bacterium]|jgi:DNA repair protein RecN (Recombination protein N)
MLVQLTISNFAIISHLETHFKPGLNILSGETGAGKSIIISAVNLILGGRASADLIRSGSNEARVEALFSLPENPAMETLFSELGLPFDGELVIKRHISREGRNRITINRSMSTLQMLSRVGLMLISISGQHEHQLLLKPDNHLYLLDDFGSLTHDRLELNVAFGQYQSLKEGRYSLEREIRESEEKQDLARFQREEIEKANLKEGEDRLVEEERKRLQYAEQLLQIITETYQTLYEKERALVSELALRIKGMEKGAAFDQRLSSVKEVLSSAKVELEEAALTLRDIQKTIVIDPHRLEEVEERLQWINRLKRKYGSSIEEIMKFKERVSIMMDNLDQRREELERINREIKAAEEEIVSKAALLSKKRKQAANAFEKSVKRELDLLDMRGTRFEVRFHQEMPDPGDTSEKAMRMIKADGYDRVEFMLSPNVGEELKPLSKIASGGELSRIMLALKTILARTASVETIIFDEVDSGIGGGTAEVVGEKLNSLAEYHQILCITHLPQIASKGPTHFLVQKKVVEGRTRTIISELDLEDRVKEIARLLGGKRISQKAIAHAREILG